MIKQFEVEGLNDSMSFNRTLHSDLNIITGKNGSGKTTLLKIIWYMLSSNLERILPEIPFSRAKLITDSFSIELKRPKKGKSERILINTIIGNKSIRDLDNNISMPTSTSPIEMVNRRLVEISGSSIFFSTFRRIEGGFSLQNRRRDSNFASRASAVLADAMSNYANSISVYNHRFIASVSTSDLEELLTREYANISEQTNKLQAELSQYIAKTIRKQPRQGRQSSQLALEDATRKLDEIQKKTERIEQDRLKLLKPFEVLSDLIFTIFNDKGVQITPSLFLGHSLTGAIPANSLSAGEKQMLSFLCYNAFSHNSVIFIDEPEISLHMDWQRILISTLLNQKTNNQFIIATHSPMIYSKYPEKEHILDEMRRH